MGIDEKQEREALLALERSEARFRSLVLATSHSVWITTPDGVVEDSPSWRAFTGQTLEEYVGLGWLEVIHPDDRERVWAAWCKAREANAPHEMEYRARRHDGVYRHLLARAAPVVGRDGRITEWIGATTDITERKEEEHLRELYVGMLGHDLRNPLASIVTSASLLTRHGSLSPEDACLVERIARAGERMRRMIDQILDLTRSRLGGGIPVVPRPAELHDLVRRIVAELEAAYPGRTIRLETNGAPQWQCDADRLGQVISNLVGNALENTGTDDPVDVSVTQPDAEVRIAVHNGGPPIPDDLLAVLFDPFRSRALPRERRSSGGLGLGLYISQQIVASHGGRIEVASSAEAGTTFTVVLPATTA
jgi:PAS domain S-box-containing protein